MKSSQLARRFALVAGGASLVVMGTLTAGCSTSTKEEPTTTAPATTAPSASSAAPVSPTEKAVGPGGENSFSPTINPTPPGASCKTIVNGVCQR
ncbi:MAG: hypothetical protein NTY24_15255 [Mycobacterium sp.]|jgi:hypothetical protein|nr:hypothetical protein [Mycobacterium sp.]MCX6481682.1 hypothetical protein [Mycobacterium sp.]